MTKIMMKCGWKLLKKVASTPLFKMVFFNQKENDIICNSVLIFSII